MDGWKTEVKGSFSRKDAEYRRRHGAARAVTVNPASAGRWSPRPGETPPGAGWAPAQLPPGEAGPSFTTRPAYRGKEEPMKELWNNFVKDESGQGLVEYVLIIALVAIGLIAIMLVFRNSIGGIFRTIADTLDEAPAQEFGT
jgi:pilus assembly protein Flp/PilA